MKKAFVILAVLLLAVSVAVTVSAAQADEALSVLKSAGEDAYVIGKVADGDGVVIE